MGIKRIKQIKHRGKSGKGRVYIKRVAEIECDHCGKAWEAKRFNPDGKLFFCSRKCTNAASKSGGKIDQAKRDVYLEKYGVDNPLKSKEVRDRRKETILDKYGVDHIQHSNEWKEKRRQTMLERYDGEYFRTDEFREKSRETSLAKYGVENPIQSAEVLETRRQNCIEKYGVDSPMQLKEIQEKMVATHYEKWGRLACHTPETWSKAYLTRVGVTRDEYLAQLPEFEAYKDEVRRITESQPINTLNNHEQRGRTKYHLDHEYSIAQGFKDGIDPKIIGNICNLRFIPAKDNRNKSDKCSITKQQLMERYELQQED